MKAKQLIQKQNVLVLAIVTYAFTLLLPQLSNGMYDPKHGRWLQRDPAGYMDGMNLYEYARSRPTVFADPSGKWGHDVHMQKTQIEHNNLSKIIIQLDLDKNIVKKWKSISYLCKTLKISDIVIRRAIQKQKKYKGFYWKFDK